MERERRGDRERGRDSGKIWRARHRAAPIEEIQRKRDYATCAAAALPSNVKNFFSFAIVRKI